jgi:AraC family transcriptional regulator of adaptative response/methylated-DNA-[protein]-cysteine methyltransferase
MMNSALLDQPNPMPRQFDDDPRWAAVLARSAEADGRFVYAVTSTGVFCRPTCPSRRPRRDQVSFFPTAADAERAGFRACLRCKPIGARPVTDGARAVAKAASYLRSHADQTVELADLAALTDLSPSHLQRAFTAHTGVSPREFQAACRAERFRESLRRGHDVTTATYEAGYGSPSRVSAHKPTGAGLTPAAYRKRGDGVAIGYAVVPCSLGRLLVAATPTGICAVRLGSADQPLVDELRREFPKAEVSETAPPAAWTRAITRAVDGVPGAVPGVPLDVQGTAFQWKVWKALQAIPAGETRTYAEVAQTVGRPSAVRAVASACARNPVAVVVPCHRVVPKAGGFGGYRWGAARKRTLLEREAQPVRRAASAR